MKKSILILATSLILVNCTAVHKFNVDACPKWANNIKNPDNLEFIEEVAFNLNKTPQQVTQTDFNDRYVNN
jgi:hypothetical protein